MEARDAGEVLPPAANMGDMNAVITNSTVDGILAALFAVMIVVVILDASRVWFKAIRAREPLPSTEAEYVESKIVAPAGLFTTAEERAGLGGAGGGHERVAPGEREPARTGGEP
jgi:carbon starvation protein